MWRSRSFAACGSLLAVVMVMSGCAIVDQYSGRAVNYNLEAEQALDQGLLLNIVRASLRRPMQFTSVASISGTASVSNTAGVSIPFGAGGASYKSGTFGGSISGGPTFTVPVLDTQEFYQGVMSPVTLPLFDFFIQEGYPSEELFTLLVEKIVIHRDACAASDHTSNCEIVFWNYPGNELQFDLTQSFIEYLLNLGLTTEPLTSQGGSKSASSSAAGSGSASPAPASPEFRFCFAARQQKYRRQIVDADEHCGSAKAQKPAARKTVTTKTTIHKKITEPDKKTTTIDGTTTAVAPDTSTTTSSNQGGRKQQGRRLALSDEFIDKLKWVADYAEQKKGQPQKSSDYFEFIKHIDAFRGSRTYLVKGKKQRNSITFATYTRSTEGILYFLGEVVRADLNPDNLVQPGLEPRIIKIKIGKTFDPVYSELPCGVELEVPGQGGHKEPDFSCQNLFVLESAPALVGFSDASVTYRGTQYSVPSDLGQQGKTLHVLSIVKQLYALNMSAKSLPQTNIISVVSP